MKCTHYLKPLTTAIALTAAVTSAHAANWSSTSFLLHDGSGYKSVPSDTSFDQTTITLEHASGWNYGDNFFFIDINNPEKGDSNFYGEFSPRFSLSKISGKSFALGPIKDVSIATTLEMGEITTASLVGFGFDFNIPNVPVAKVNVYQRFSQSDLTFSNGFKPYEGETGSAPQVTLVWMAPFTLGKTSWVFEGFLDYAWAEKDVGKVANLVTQPRILLDAGALFGAPKQLYVGIEQMIWRNKYGSDGIDDNVSQLTLKWTF